jgi:Ser/Thr protein kinase RdoA (MazF antagonist)
MTNAQYWINHFVPANSELQAVFLNLVPDDCKEILKKHDLSYVKGISFESAENRVFGFDTVIIKFYRPERWSFKAIEEELEFLEDLREADVSFVRPVGKVGTWRGVHYLVFEKIQQVISTDKKILNESEVREMVRLVAQVHDVGEKRIARERPSFDPEGMSTGCFEVIKRAGFLPESLHGRYQKVIDEFISKIAALGEIPVQRVHGDTYSGNVIWTSKGPVFMDLDDFQMGPVALDVKLLSFPWRLDTLSESMDRKERRRIQHQMVLDLYREFRSFPKEWEALFPLLSVYRDIQFDAWFSARWNDPGFASNYQDDDITTLDWWIDSIEALEDSVSK